VIASGNTGIGLINEILCIVRVIARPETSLQTTVVKIVLRAYPKTRTLEKMS
jgi:hypothetical protein